MTLISPDLEIREEIREHAAKAFFASAWAELQEVDPNGMNLSGCEIMDVMPQELDPSAYEAADRLIAELEENEPVLETVETVCNWCWLQWYQSDIKTDRECTPEMFGHYLAMQAMGHGVGLESVTPEPDEINVPYVEYGFDKFTEVHVPELEED